MLLLKNTWESQVLLKQIKFEYYISNSDITLTSEADSSNYYFIFPKCKSNVKNVTLNNQNIILSINGTEFRSNKCIRQQKFNKDYNI